MFPVSIDSDEAWDGLIDVVRDVGGAKGSSSPVRVELMADWVRKEVPAVRAASPPADLLGEDDTGEEDEQEVAPPAKKARKSATTKALADLEEARKVEEAVGNSVAALLTQWECTKKGCPHHARGKGVCFVVNGLHYEVRFDDLGQWSKAIRQGHATVTVPPASLMLRMRRDGDPGPSPSLAAAPAAPATPHGHPTASSQCAHLPAACAHVPTPSWALAPPWPAAPWSAAPPLPPPPPYALQPERLSARATADSPTRQRGAAVRGSSPVDSNSDPIELLLSYFEWQARRVPAMAAMIRAAADAVVDEAYDLEGLRKMTKEDWKDMDVGIGLGKRLSREVDRFWKLRKSGSLPALTGGGGGLGMLADAATAAE